MPGNRESLNLLPQSQDLFSDYKPFSTVRFTMLVAECALLLKNPDVPFFVCLFYSHTKSTVNKILPKMKICSISTQTHADGKSGEVS